MKKTLLFLTILIFSSLSPLSADTLRIHGAFLIGQNEHELERRVFLDDLNESAGFGRLNFSWDGLSDFMVRPLGLEFEKTLRKDKDSLIFGANVWSSGGDVSYISIGPLPSVSFTELMDFITSETDLYAGFRIRIPQTQFTAAPVAGVRFFAESFEYSSVTFAPGMYVFNPAVNVWEASGSALYGGIRGDYQLGPEFDLYGEFLISAPGGFTDGKMKHDRMSIGLAGMGGMNTVILGLEYSSASYRTGFYTLQAGLRYWITKDFNIFGGYRQEVYSVSYPGYYNLPFYTYGGGYGSGLYSGFDISEFISDYVLYSLFKSETRRGILQAGLSYNIDI